MGEKTREGVYAREASILIYFRWAGKSYRETLKLEPTPKNLAYASSVRKSIMRAIALGTFTLGEYFPDSKYANQSSLGERTDRAIERYIEHKQRTLAPTTTREYRNALTAFFADVINEPLGVVDFAMIDRKLSQSGVSGKTHNNLVSCIRGLFDYAVRCKWVTENPTAGFEFARVSEPEPDPLDREEMEAVIADMAEHYHPQVANYFEGAMWLGWRPSEGITLDWGNLDRRKGMLRITGARVRGIVKGTKTNRSRDVELDDRAMAVFERQREHTLMTGGRIFRNPATGNDWWDTSDLVARYWRPSLKRLGIRNRDARQTRHTCATLLLMAGCNPAWCAGQLGHSVEMFLRVYSRWIVGGDKGRERAKLGEFSQTFHKTKKSP